ncbi:MAG: M16 family metallopeptidase [Thermoanaerobaculia bacterium]
MRSQMLRIAVALAVGTVLSVAGGFAQSIPERPEELAYGPLRFEVPDASGFRHELPGGIVAYVVPDRSLPLVSVVLHLRTGAFRESAAQPGVASMTASLMRVGGTAERTPEEFDERADFLAAQIGSSAGDTGARVSLNVLSTSLDDGLDLLFEMLRTPRFDDSRLAIEKSKALEAMKQRNDDAGDIQTREWSWLMYGRDHFSSRRATAAQLGSITRADLVDFHRRTYGAEEMVIAVSGDVDAKAIVANLSRRLRGFRAGERAPWPPPASDYRPTPGLYHVEKDIPQGKVSIGHRSIRVTDWSNPELAALDVMNDILGGGGFTSRLVKRIRSDEGLAYGAGSNYGLGVFWPGVFGMGYASKNPTVAYAMEILLEEVDRIRREPVTAEELAIARSSAIDTFPRAFESAAQIAGTFAQDELIGRPHSYWTGYRARIGAVTAADVLAVAQKYLHPDELVTLVVGKWSEIAPGDPEGRATMEQFAGGKVEHLPLRDPLTLQP